MNPPDTCDAATTASPAPPRPLVAPWTGGAVPTAAGEIPRIRTRLGIRDHLGTLWVRSGFGRSRYRVPAGVYAVGTPDARSPVLVTANYKLSFDHLRRNLDGRHAWVLVLDTHGINVWCAAGKGTFGTAEVVRRVKGTALDRIVTHRTLVLPQLGAPGVSAHEVRRRAGFRVVYGPVRAADLPAFLDARMKADPATRRVRFGLRDRAVLIPVELVLGAKLALPVAAAFLLVGGLGPDGYSTARVATAGASGAAVVLGAFVAGATLGPLLLPWLPGRAFALKGAALGLALVAALALVGAPGWASAPWTDVAALALLVPTVTSFVVMNFTGATTFTSLSGVLREMRLAVPAQIAGAVAGLALWLIGLFTAGGPVT